MNIIEIDKRYSELSKSDCCLSCGGAINYADAKPGETCVDLGSGRGTDVLRLAENVGENGFVYGIDISEGMLEKARKTAENLGVTNVRYLKNELEKIEIPSNSVDVVISNCTLNHASDKQAVWNEIYRILKIGGRFIISDIYATSKVPDEYRTDPVAVSECWAGATTREEYLKQLENAGFQTINIVEESAPYSKGKINVCSWTINGNK